jgi:hypothetical protein
VGDGCNGPAIAFYHAIGMQLRRVHAGAARESRKLKPEIPLVGVNGMAIEDEHEFEIVIRR